MATKKAPSRSTKSRKVSRQTDQVEPMEMMETEEMVVTTNSYQKNNRRWIFILLLAAVGLVLFWQKTNTWPVAAFVNGRPISRFELNQQLYKQGGSQTLEGMISQRLIETEVAKNNVQVTDDEINKRLDEIKSSLGDNYASALSAQGLTEDALKKQLKLQLSMEKLLSDKATVSAEEIKQVAPDGKDTESAEKYLKQQKLQQAISTWVQELRTKAKIFIVGEKTSDSQK
jgi:foldase protein PrsA